VDGIFLFMWKIFGLHGKNKLKKLCATHKSSTHCSRAHVHMIVVLPFATLLLKTVVVTTKVEINISIIDT
jgi:hypothetical protein